jgi:hypothetical protein
MEENEGEIQARDIKRKDSNGLKRGMREGRMVFDISSSFHEQSQQQIQDQTVMKWAWLNPVY